MRPPKIDIEPWVLERGQNMTRRAMNFQRTGVLARTDEDEFDRPMLQGFCVRYNKTFLMGGRFTVFLKAAFADSLNTRVPVFMDHDEKMTFGSDGLELIDTPEGVAFRFMIGSSARRKALARMSLNFQRSDVSISYMAEKKNIVSREIDGRICDFVVRASIRELSFVKDGRCPYAFGKLIDAAAEPTLRQSAERGLLRFDAHARELQRALHDDKVLIDNLVRAVAALSA